VNWGGEVARSGSEVADVSGDFCFPNLLLSRLYGSMVSCFCEACRIVKSGWLPGPRCKAKLTGAMRLQLRFYLFRGRRTVDCQSRALEREITEEMTGYRTSFLNAFCCSFLPHGFARLQVVQDLNWQDPRKHCRPVCKLCHERLAHRVRDLYSSLED
jgi:hypothetical protein